MNGNGNDTTRDLTANLTVDEKLNLILAELAEMNAWRAHVDAELAETRAWRAHVNAILMDQSRDTRPMLELIHKDVADLNIGQNEIKFEVRQLGSRLDGVVYESFDVKTKQREFERRVLEVERRLFSAS